LVRVSIRFIESLLALIQSVIATLFALATISIVYD